MDYAIVIWPITVLLTVVGWLLVRRFLERYAFDHEYEAVTPGVSARERRQAQSRVRRQDLPVAVAFHPPQGVRPGELGILIHRTAHREAYLATLVDLALRGYITMTPTGDGDHVFESTNKSRDDLVGFEAGLLRGIFSKTPQVTQRQLQQPEYQDLRRSFGASLDQRVKALGWFKPNAAVFAVGGLGIIVAMVGAGIVEWGLIRLYRGQSSFWWPLGLPIMFAGLQGLFSLRKSTGRTAEGSAVLAQAKGFERYLMTAEQRQLRFEEDRDVLNRYLPYAIVFGLVDQWTGELNRYAKAAQRDRERSAYAVRSEGSGSYQIVVGLPKWLNRLLGRPEEPKDHGASPDARN